jgi:hypothetical protein
LESEKRVGRIGLQPEKMGKDPLPRKPGETTAEDAKRDEGGGTIHVGEMIPDGSGLRDSGLKAGVRSQESSESRLEAEADCEIEHSSAVPAGARRRVV